MENKVIKEEIQESLHKVFVDLSRENDLKDEELEWFRSRINLKTKEVEEKEEKKIIQGAEKLEILTIKDLEKPPGNTKKLYLKLGETETLWFFSLESGYSEDNAEDAERIRRRNATYEMKKVKKELVRKRYMAETQTPRFIEKAQGCLTEKINMIDVGVFASEWDLYDTYNALEKKDEIPQQIERKKPVLMDDSTSEVTTTTSTETTEEEVSQILKSSEFRYASLVTERLLASNCFQTEQSVFKKIYKMEYDEEPTLFSYNMEPLWSFKKDLKRSLMVTDMDWNPLNQAHNILENLTFLEYISNISRCNQLTAALCLIWLLCRVKKLEQLTRVDEDIPDCVCPLMMPLLVIKGETSGISSSNRDLLAVAYGDLRFYKNSVGLICVWSPKNPRQPERQFAFENSVTSLHFSRVRPNILAAGTRIGNIYVLDVSSLKGNTRLIGSDNFSPRPGPIWKVEWFLCKELVFESEELLAVGESGILMRFTEQTTKDILKMNYVTLTNKKFDKKSLKKIRRGAYIQEVIFDKKTFSGLYFSLTVDRNYCYVSTKEGVIVKCNMRNPSMTEGVFLGHDGPIYTIQHSPASDLIYFTCGADWNIRIWIEGITEPLITLQHKAPIVCGRWSPKISTLIATISETEVCLWDISRNILSPMSFKNFENCKKPFSTLIFSKNGKNLIVGGQDGLARVLNLSHLPRIPFLKKEALIAAIKKAISKNQDGLKDKFRRILELNAEKLKTEILEELQSQKPSS